MTDRDVSATARHWPGTVRNHVGFPTRSSAGHGRAVLARAGRMLLDKDYGSRRGRTGSDDGRSVEHPRW